MQEQPSEEDQSLNIINVINSMNRRLRVLEERHSNLHRKTEVVEDNMLNNSQKNALEMKRISGELKEIRKEIAEVRDSMRLLITDLKGRAKKEDIDVVQQYINLWNPTNFVTQREVEKIVRRIVNEK